LYSFKSIGVSVYLIGGMATTSLNKKLKGTGNNRVTQFFEGRCKFRKTSAHPM